MDYELTLFDRLNVIKDTINKYGEDKFYLSFSGGKDSTILHYLLDMALPNNNIPRVFLDTGIEYDAIKEFVLSLSQNDSRFVIIKPSQPIKQMLERVGYPFKSKEHSLRVEYFNKGSEAKFIKKYIWKSETQNCKYLCPKSLLYQFEERGKYHYSNKCCYELKKKPAHLWAKANHKSIVITGMRNEEGGNRERLGCLTNKNTKFHPLIKVDNEWEETFIKENNIKLCKLYYPPYNFYRTGCKGCPFNPKLESQLETMEKLLPNERKQCEIIWKPVYEEYRRIGYRLKRKEENK